MMGMWREWSVAEGVVSAWFLQIRVAWSKCDVRLAHDFNRKHHTAGQQTTTLVSIQSLCSHKPVL